MHNQSLAVENSRYVAELETLRRSVERNRTEKQQFEEQTNNLALELDSVSRQCSVERNEVKAARQVMIDTNEQVADLQRRLRAASEELSELQQEQKRWQQQEHEATLALRRQNSILSRAQTKQEAKDALLEVVFLSFHLRLNCLRLCPIYINLI